MSIRSISARRGGSVKITGILVGAACAVAAAVAHGALQGSAPPSSLADARTLLDRSAASLESALAQAQEAMVGERLAAELLRVEPALAGRVELLKELVRAIRGAATDRTASDADRRAALARAARLAQGAAAAVRGERLELWLFEESQKIREKLLDVRRRAGDLGRANEALARAAARGAIAAEQALRSELVGKPQPPHEAGRAAARAAEMSQKLAKPLSELRAALRQAGDAPASPAVTQSAREVAAVASALRASWERERAAEEPQLASLEQSLAERRAAEQAASAAAARVAAAIRAARQLFPALGAELAAVADDSELAAQRTLDRARKAHDRTLAELEVRLAARATAGGAADAGVRAVLDRLLGPTGEGAAAWERSVRRELEATAKAMVDLSEAERASHEARLAALREVAASASPLEAIRLLERPERERLRIERERERDELRTHAAAVEGLQRRSAALQERMARAAAPRGEK
ncbi:MAG: hypothetical protein JNJ88_09970 [Planctomycetes bacterium]|nr:hypothetical protein [Planctomycetota bacterium]